ncbi:MAG: hypothetical protein R3Y40_07170 [Eubacteriales bacterium]
MKTINKNLKTQTTALSLFLQSGLSIYIGLIMIYDYIFFVRQSETLLLVYFWAVIGVNIVQLVIGFKKGVRQIAQNIFTILGARFAIWFIYDNLERILSSVAQLMCMWTCLLGICSLISFLQYRREKSSAPLRYLLSAILHIVFSVLFIRYFTNHQTVGSKFIGLYLVLIGSTFFLDGLAQAVPDAYINRFKNHLRIALPAYLAAFIPLRVLNGMNEYFKENTEEGLDFEVVKDEREVNVEVYVHVSKLLKGTTGHVDIAIDDVIYCYGTYDRESLKWGGIVGTGVLYEVYNKEEYLTFCKSERQETIFEFGLALTEEELERVKVHIGKMKSRTYIWLCKSQRAEKMGEDTSPYQEPACKLSRATRTVFYKFNTGAYKYYWFLGTNCVKFTDDILRASGMRTILTGIITPGTYFSFLNDAFMKGNSSVISRTIHYAIENMETKEV